MRWFLWIFGLGLLVGGLWWFQKTERVPQSVADAVAEPVAGPEVVPKLELPEESAAVVETRAPVPEPDPVDLAAEAEEAAAAAQAAANLTLICDLLRPNRTRVEASAVALLRTNDGAERTGELGDEAGRLVFTDIAPGPHQLTVEVAGYQHEMESLEVVRPDTGSEVYHRAYLWPENWVPIHLRTSDGRPFTALADDQEWEHKRLFVNAFFFAAALDADPSAALAAGADPLAVYHPPPGYQNVTLPGDVAGSLELKADPPLWVGMWIYGKFHSGETLEPEDSKLTFTVDFADLEERMAKLTVTLVDRDTGTPVLEALGTLKADISAHRRADLSDVEPDENGLLTFEHVIPGQHELAVTRGENLVQRRVLLRTGQHLDLGELPIGSGPGIRITVVDAKGEPVVAFVELAPYQKGRYVQDLYHPNLHRQTDENGVYILPAPDQSSIVRVRTIQGGGFASDPACTNRLLDPAALPQELRIVLQARVSVLFEPSSPWKETDRLVIADGLGLIVDVVEGEDAGALRSLLLPGPYSVSRQDEAGVELGRLEVVVDAAKSRLSSP